MLFRNQLRALYHFLPQKLRMGQAYHKLYDKYAKLMQRPYEERLAYQLEELKRVIRYAYEHTRYYRKLFDEYGILPEHIQDFSDIKKIPLLTKDIVKSNLEDMVADCIPRKDLQYVTTGGTTGKPLGLYITRSVDRRRLAFEWINWGLFGYEMGMPCAVLRGQVIEDGWFYYHRGDNYLYLSAYDLKENNMYNYLSKLEEFHAPFLCGYPSALESVSKYILRKGISFNEIKWLKGIFTSSEMLYSEQKQLIENAFNAPVFDKYGNCEQVGGIGMCKEGLYHEVMEHSFLEYLRDDGTDAIDGETAEIVGTTFVNDAVPFIRYKTGDGVLISDRKKCSCGVESRLFERIEGRWSSRDMLVTRDGNLISVAALNSHSDIFDNTHRIQYYQDTVGEVILKIVPMEEYTVDDSEKIKAELAPKLKDMNFSICLVDDIPVTGRGKHKQLDQRLVL